MSNFWTTPARTFRRTIESWAFTSREGGGTMVPMWIFHSVGSSRSTAYEREVARMRKI
jgi:hypothetical protein